MQLSTAVYSAAQPFDVLFVATRAAEDVAGTAAISAHFTHGPSSIAIVIGATIVLFPF